MMTGFLLMMTVFGVDLGIKEYVERHVDKNEERKIWNRRGILRKVYNRGMMMNRLDQHPLIVQLASVFSGGVLLICQAILFKQPGRKKEKIGLSLMLAGALGNTYDRVKRGYVVDYLAIKTKHKKLSDITFNLADISIFAGVFMVFLGELCSRKKNKR